MRPFDLVIRSNLDGERHAIRRNAAFNAGRALLVSVEDDGAKHRNVLHHKLAAGRCSCGAVEEAFQDHAQVEDERRDDVSEDNVV